MTQRPKLSVFNDLGKQKCQYLTSCKNQKLVLKDLRNQRFWNFMTWKHKVSVFDDLETKTLIFDIL